MVPDYESRLIDLLACAACKNDRKVRKGERARSRLRGSTRRHRHISIPNQCAILVSRAFSAIVGCVLEKNEAVSYPLWETTSKKCGGRARECIASSGHSPKGPSSTAITTSCSGSVRVRKATKHPSKADFELEASCPFCADTVNVHNNSSRGAGGKLSFISGLFSSLLFKNRQIMQNRFCEHATL